MTAINHPQFSARWYLDLASIEAHAGADELAKIDGDPNYAARCFDRALGYRRTAEIIALAEQSGAVSKIQQAAE